MFGNMAGAQSTIAHPNSEIGCSMSDVALPEHEFSKGVPRQSGLSLAFSDGAPVVPEMTPGRSRQLAFKRATDVVLSLCALFVLSPLLVAVALAIRWTSKGEVLFRQRRHGLGGAPIEVYKFRSMYLDRCDATGVAQTTKDDPRVTPIGRIIRRTSIDELPQLFNILRGDMSLVGPRPHAFGMLAGGRPYEELVPYYHVRHAMKPGLSGWAQANGLRGPTDNPKVARARIDHDVAYIQNFSLWLDSRIIVRTLAREVFGGSGD